MAPALLTCSACGRHAKASAPACPVCGEALRRPDGSIPRAAAAILLGLATTTIACGHDSTPSNAGGVGGGNGAAGAGGTNTGGQMSSATGVPFYGPAPSTGSSSSTSSSTQTLYGPAPSTGGAGGTGGSGGK